MKKVVLVIIALLFVATLSAEVNLEALKADHLNAMKYNGRADVLQQKNSIMYYTHIETEMASIFQTEELVTGYTVMEGKKVYWEVTPVEGGIKITIKINILGKIFERSFIIKTSKNNVNIELTEDDNRGWDYECLRICAVKALKCLHCLQDWWGCWAKCVGPIVVPCVMKCYR
ncbi:MAG TPA: hypothetical protein P5543_06655 [Planctomycetota bacterium]|nr:hypothetical protein [Planctomycetota bacterium]HRU51851.1 hypothetical protein [Planctomycetota bacterium]